MVYNTNNLVLTDELWPIHVCLCGLYLRGLPRPSAISNRRWPQVEHCLRVHAPSLGAAATTLRREGFPEESLILDGVGVLAAAEEVAEDALTPVLPYYPHRWQRALGSFAPAALWSKGVVPSCSWFGIVGSRELPLACRQAAIQVAHEAVQAGFGLISGGAAGADQIAQQVAEATGAPLLVVHPRGQLPDQEYGTHLTAAAPGEPFSAGLAMERNALIYAGSEVTYVAHARLRTGGSWHGALEAIRRNLTRVCVPPFPDEGLTALSRLGAETLSSATSLRDLLNTPAPGQRLFQLTG